MARKLDDWLKAYMAYTIPLEAPDKFHFWTGVSTIAGALRRRCWFDMGMFQWYPNFYIILVAPPGIVSKSTTLNVGMRLLRKVKDIHFGPDAVTWPALTQALAASRIDYPIGQLGMVPMSCITIASSEFGTFLNPNDREMVDVLVDLWDSRVGSWEKRTKTSGADKVVNPWINIAACTTPGWIAGNFPEYLIGGGFTSRCIFVFADEKRRLIAYPGAELPPEFKSMEADLIHDLQEIARMQGEFTLTDGARAFGVQWYTSHYKELNSLLQNPQFSGYLARKQTHIHKLAMILSASESDNLIITETHLRAADAIISSLEQDMPAVFSHIGAQGGSRHFLSIMDIVRAQRKIGKRDLYRQVSGRMSHSEFADAMEGAIFSGWVKAEMVGNQVYYTYIPDPEKKDGQQADEVIRDYTRKKADNS